MRMMPQTARSRAQLPLKLNDNKKKREGLYWNEAESPIKMKEKDKVVNDPGEEDNNNDRERHGKTKP